ncbi:MULTISPECIES: PIG-L family deacetylase [unclassified Microbacterium]|uniref:PIG-L family deacetylase n=1 Tax=unclassified Microbacterium TaxID=2609290 RepID=UPI0038653250
MSVSFDHREHGTAERAWQTTEIPAEPLDMSFSHLVVVAAHPDDETLGAGGLLATAAAAGVEVTVVVATDGEATLPETRRAGVTRRAELTAALARLAPRARLRFLGLPDGGLREHAGDLSDLLIGEFRAVDPADALIAVTWWGDGHRDHRVLGEAVLATAGSRRVVGYPIWYWHWGDPARPDPGPWLRLPLTPGVMSAKAAAIAEHGSQQRLGADADPVLHENMLSHFHREAEMFIAVPPPSPAAPAASAASVEPAHFEEYFARHDDPWGFDSRWYEERKRALVLASLPRRRFARTLELGCATAALTAELATRSDEIVGVDASAVALERARRRLPSVRFEELVLPADWPEGTWNLIVLSELGYYWSRDDLGAALEKITATLRPDGVLVACHWRRPLSDAPLDAAIVHEAIARTGLERLARHIDEDVILEVWVTAGTPSVAEAEGLA